MFERVIIIQVIIVIQYDQIFAIDLLRLFRQRFYAVMFSGPCLKD